MFFYCYRCSHCGQKCMTAAVLVRPWVECKCGHLFQVPANSKLAFKREVYVDLHRIVRSMSRN